MITVPEVLDDKHELGLLRQATIDESINLVMVRRSSHVPSPRVPDLEALALEDTSCPRRIELASKRAVDMAF